MNQPNLPSGFSRGITHREFDESAVRCFAPGRAELKAWRLRKAPHLRGIVDRLAIDFSVNAFHQTFEYLAGTDLKEWAGFL